MGLVQRPAYAVPVFASLQAAPLAASTYYITSVPSAPGVNPSVGRIYVPLQSTLMRVVLLALCGTPGSAETGTISLRVNNTTDYTVTSTMQWNASVNAGFNSVEATGPLVTDELEVTSWVEIKIATPAVWVTPALNVLYQGWITFAGTI